ncbi:ATP synthase F1 subunit gamma [bacterium]|nr:ATP synthase F1 subunit gamma [bacterium]
MESAKDIKNRINSIKNTKKITKAMEMIAASKMKKQVKLALSGKNYAEYALSMMINIVRNNKGIKHPFLKKNKDIKNVLIIILTSDKGLCGGYNINIFKSLNKYIDENKEKNIDAICIGKYAQKYAKKLNINIVKIFPSFGESIKIDEIDDLNNFIKDEFLKEKYDRIKIIYTNFISPISNNIKIRRLLPLTEKNMVYLFSEIGKDDENIDENYYRDKNNVDYIFEPSPEIIFDKVIPILVKIEIYQCILESLASEHSLRMIAMKNASDNAGKIVDRLLLKYNKVRQASITSEILEISSGAEALNS